jgi:hypothetical protein
MSRSGINACLCGFGPPPTVGVARLTLVPGLLSTPLRCHERHKGPAGRGACHELSRSGNQPDDLAHVAARVVLAQRQGVPPAS